MELFLRLVRNALWQTEEDLPEELTANMASNILRGAKEQGLIGLVTDALKRNNVRMPKKQSLEMTVMLMKVRLSNEHVNEGLRHLKELFDSRGIDYVVVKGQAVGAYYPDPMLRQAGDIDYYCDAYNFPKAQDAVREEWGIETEMNEERHLHYDYKGIAYEGHFMLFMFYRKKLDRYWERLVNENGNRNVRIDGMEVKTLPTTLHTLFVFLHLFVHLMDLGIGFRHFCDLAVMLHHGREEIDYDQMRNILKKTGMEKAFRAIGCILTDYLGLPTQDVGYDLTERDRKYTKRILDFVRLRGNMGSYNLLYNNMGWISNLELACIKLTHFVKLWPLSPSYCCRWFLHKFKKHSSSNGEGQRTP